MAEPVAQHGPLKAHAVRVDRMIAGLAEQHEAVVVRPAAERTGPLVARRHVRVSRGAVGVGSRALGVEARKPWSR